MQNKHVSALAWVVSSPSLINHIAEGPAVIGSIKDSWIEHWLLSLDQNPTPLIQHLSKEKSHFLGPYFEALWAFYLSSNPRYKVISKNLQANSPTRTVGEFDFILFDNENKNYIHQEIAIKFYLGFPQKNQYSFADPDTLWIGPQSRDRLDLKMDKMVHSQAKLASTQSGKEALRSVGIDTDIDPIKSEILVKGTLFYPWGMLMKPPSISHPNHLSGSWVKLKRLAEYLNSAPTDAWTLLTKPDWLGPGRIDNRSCSNTLFTHKHEAFEAIKTKVASENRPWMMSCLKKHNNDYIETHRFFVVPNHWPHPLT